MRYNSAAASRLRAATLARVECTKRHRPKDPKKAKEEKRIIIIIIKLGLFGVAYRIQDRIRTLRYRLSSRRTARVEGLETQGIPIPPADLIYLVSGSPETTQFLQVGKSAPEVILSTLGGSGIDMAGLQAVLDFGCRCGRVMRFWHTRKGPRLYGVDYNPKLIAWSRKHLPFARFNTNKARPPLSYADCTFDFIYAISVFTHLSEDLQFAWLKELARVLQPGGHLLITAHGESRVGEMDQDELQAFRAGRLVIRHEDVSDMNICAVYHPQGYVKETLSPATGLSVVDFIPAGTRASFNQDVYLLRGG